jgi:CheY-like chemotaxis protein
MPIVARHPPIGNVLPIARRLGLTQRQAARPYGMPTVLVVDDEAIIRKSLRQLFERSGLEVREAESGAAALEMLVSQPEIDAIVSDYVMPGVDGLAFYDELVSRLPHLRDRVVFFTGVARQPTVSEQVEQRGVPLIHKLDDLRIVLDAVRLAILRREEPGAG